MHSHCAFTQRSTFMVVPWREFSMKVKAIFMTSQMPVISIAACASCSALTTIILCHASLGHTCNVHCISYRNVHAEDIRSGLPLFSAFNSTAVNFSIGASNPLAAVAASAGRFPTMIDTMSFFRFTRLRSRPHVDSIPSGWYMFRWAYPIFSCHSCLEQIHERWRWCTEVAYNCFHISWDVFAPCWQQCRQGMNFGSASRSLFDVSFSTKMQPRKSLDVPPHVVEMFANETVRHSTTHLGKSRFSLEILMSLAAYVATFCNLCIGNQTCWYRHRHAQCLLVTCVITNNRYLVQSSLPMKNGAKTEWKQFHDSRTRCMNIILWYPFDLYYVCYERCACVCVDVRSVTAL